MKHYLISFFLVVVAFVAGWFASSAIFGSLQEPFLDAARRGDTRSMQTLFRLGANPHFGAGESYSPILEAASHGQPESVQWLLDHHVDPNVQHADNRPLTAARWRLQETKRTIEILEAHGATDPWQNESGSK